MMKRLAILALFVATWHVGAQVPGQRGEKYDHAPHDANKTNNDTQSLAQPTLDLRVTVHDHDWEAKHKAAQEQSHNWKEAFWPGTWSNWALVVVGGIAGFLAWRTLRKIGRQADLMSRQTVLALAAAKAAQKSVAAFVNKERSRLFITKITEGFKITVTAVNRGQSPARITYEFVGCQIYDSTEQFPDVPDYAGDGEPADYITNIWVLPGKSDKIGSYDASYISEKNPELLKQVMSGDCIVWFYGIVRWIDSVSDDEHEIRFCYKCHPWKDGRHWLTEDGPAAYRGEK